MASPIINIINPKKPIIPPTIAIEILLSYRSGYAILSSQLIDSASTYPMIPMNAPMKKITPPRITASLFKPFPLSVSSLDYELKLLSQIVNVTVFVSLGSNVTVN